MKTLIVYIIIKLSTFSIESKKLGQGDGGGEDLSLK